MKYKVGQKVCIKQWLDMPQDIQDSWGENTVGIGATAVISFVIGLSQGIATYKVLFDKSGIAKGELFVFEPELEPLVKAGEQLVFNFIKE